jgi:hypothetical protein
MMRTTVLAASAMLALWPLQAGAQDAGVADLGDFAVDTALQFCYGFFEGMAHYHDRLSAGPEIEPIVCPTGQVTRRDLVDTYLAFAKANPQYLDEDPADNVIRAAIDRWPCPE